MEFAKLLVCDRLRIPNSQVKHLSQNRFLCLVSEDWLQCLAQANISNYHQCIDLDPVSCGQLLAPSLRCLPSPWMRITVKVIPKSDQLIDSLLDGPLSTLSPTLCLTELLAHLGRENFRNLWQEAHKQYSHEAERQVKRSQQKFSDVYKQFLMRLDPLISVQCDGNTQMVTTKLHQSILTSKTQSSNNTDNILQNTVPILATLETDSSFIVVQKYIEHSLQDIVQFSPKLLTSSYAKVLWIVFQLLYAMRNFHERGLSAGELYLSNICVDSKLWVYISTPQEKQLSLRKCGASCTVLPHLSSSSSSSISSLPMSPPIGSGEAITEVATSQNIPSATDAKTVYRSMKQRSQVLVKDAQTFLQSELYKSHNILNISSLVNDWVNRRVTNFKYLMILNHLAGRRLGDPNHHPVLPWVMDFTSSEGGYRDFTRSKYRLNKGDHQLNITYESFASTYVSESNDDLTSVPHHISDVLSDITYYVYTARQTPKSILCAHVRTKWVPNEYPSSMQRMYDWTPDECIPEFFVDPTIFLSIHNDLPDLEVPLWCSSPGDFVAMHMATLESDYVSERLHHWIDLTFGYKLSGKAAVVAKNVYLQLVDQHINLTNHGIVQLFSKPHPPKLPANRQMTMQAPKIIQSKMTTEADVSLSDWLAISMRTGQNLVRNNLFFDPALKPQQEVTSQNEDQKLSKRVPISPFVMVNGGPRPERSIIKLPLNYDPLLALDQLETQCEFASKTLQMPPISAQTKGEVDLHTLKQELCSRDMQALGCVIAEMFYADQLKITPPQPTITERYKNIQKLYAENTHALPRTLGYAVEYLLKLKPLSPLYQKRNKKQKNDEDSVLEPGVPLFRYDVVDTSGLPPPNPALLLNCNINIFQFPPYFHDLYECICKLNEKDSRIMHLKLSSMSVLEKSKMSKVLSREKVAILESFLQKYHLTLNKEALELVLPYVEELFNNPDTAVQAAWHLFNVVSQMLGPVETKKKFLRVIVKLLSGENSTPKHMKLYHRVFLLQLLVRLGLQTFLDNFSTLLVEAVAGYKDFLIKSNGDYSRREDEEIEDEDIKEVSTELITIAAAAQPVRSEIVNSKSTLYEQDELLQRNLDGEPGHDIIPEEIIKGTDNEEFDEDFPENLSLGSDDEGAHHHRVKVTNYDGNSEADDDDDDDTLRQERGSVGKASLHSISHLIEASKLVSGSMDETEGVLIENGNNSVFEGEESADPSTEYGAFTCGISSDYNNSSPQFNTPSSQKVDDKNDQQAETSANDAITDSKCDANIDTNNTTNNNSNSINSSTNKYESSEKPSDENVSSSSENKNTDSAFHSNEDKSYMVRSETDEFNTSYSNIAEDQLLNICDVAQDSIKWLSHRLGPLLTAKFLSRNLIRMLALCYLGEEQIEEIGEGEVPYMSVHLVCGDKNAYKVLDCLGFVAILFGERVVLSQYIHCVMDMIFIAQKRLTVRAESALIGGLVLLRYLISYLTDKTLLDILHETIISEMLLPLMRLVSNPNISFPSGSHVRRIVCYKIVDVIYIIGLRLGFEMTRKHMTSLLQKFFKTFDSIHSALKASASNPLLNDVIGVATSPLNNTINRIPSRASFGSPTEDSYLNIKMDSQTQEYTIGTPINITSHKMSSPVFSSSRPSSWRGKAYCLSPNVAEEREEFSVELNTSISTMEHIQEELADVFTAELASKAYIPFCRIFGSIHIEYYLQNDDLIRLLCAQHDYNTHAARTMSQDSDSAAGTPSGLLSDDCDLELGFGQGSNSASSSLGQNVAVIGNRLQLQELSSTPVEMIHFGKPRRHSGILSIDPEKLKCADIEHYKHRHLKGNWLAYWEHELGLSERDTLFNFKQIKLHTFQGHTNSIRSLFVIDNENSFISASKDKTVRLWSLRSFGDGSGASRCQWTYTNHKKSVFSVAFVESVRCVASCDSTVHVWDPFTGMTIRQLESSKNSPVVAVTPVPAPSTCLITATTESTLRFLDLRTARYAQEYKCSPSSAGWIRCMSISPDASWVTVGYSSGTISVLDLRTGLLHAVWKGHDGEILQIRPFNQNMFVTSSFDQTMKVWDINSLDETPCCLLKGPTEPVHCFNFYRDQIVSATTANRIGVHTSVDAMASFSSVRLRSDTFKGVLTSMAVLPQNRTLLLGADNGTIQLLC